jgi:putative spermidine/putrescine transport system permease protein
MISEQVLFYIDWPFAAVMANALLLLMLTISVIGLRFEARQSLWRDGRARRAQ